MFFTTTKEKDMWGVMYEGVLQAAFLNWDDAEKYRDERLKEYPDWIRRIEKDFWDVKEIVCKYSVKD